MIAIDFDKWPLVLCGPMLRRVEKHQVSIFVALRFRRRVTLTIYGCTADGRPSGSIAGASAVTRRLGRRLHVVVVTVSGLQLAANQLCAYGLAFDPDGPADAEDASSAAANLASLGLLAGTTPLGYETHLLPTFRVPTDDANALEFIHASCRKLHGPGKDAMPHIDEVLKGLRTDAFKRPQMLFLTGDQIYADDVAGPLLPVLTALAHVLLGWNSPERIPMPAMSAELSGCVPGLRSVVTTRNGLTSGEAACHLLGLGEFYAMYLMAWSDVVWPHALPAPTDIYPPEVFPGGLAPLTDIAPLENNLPWLIALARAYVGNGKAWQEQSSALMAVKDGLPAVRRALANVPTYMMLDDHEVTDDWNFNRTWQLTVYGNPAGRRIVSNALLAYAAFQAWGNNPIAMFSGAASGAKLLDELEAIGRLDGTTYNETAAAVTTAQALVRVGTQTFSEGVNWDYSLECAAYRVLVLDTRTHRDATRDGQAALMTEAEMQRQITTAAPTTKAVHIVLSPAPVIGHPFVERIFQSTAGRHGFDAAVDLESWWSEQRPGPFEALLDRLGAMERVILISGDVHYGFSATLRYWNDRPGKVVTASITQLVSSSLKNESGMTAFLGGAGSHRQHAQLKATEIVLDIGETIGWGLSRGYQSIDLENPPIVGLEEALVPPAREDAVGWTSGPVTVTMGDGTPLPLTTTPSVRRISTLGETASVTPNWRYRLGFACDLARGRGTVVAAPAARPPGEKFVDRKLRLALDWRSSRGNDGDRLIVGRNNFARVSVFGIAPHLALRQEFWFRPQGQPMLPYTEHYVDLDPPLPSEVPPLAPDPQAAGQPDLSAWGGLLSTRPSDALQKKVIQLNTGAPGNWHFHHIESAWGQVNLDWYAVEIDLMPRRMPGDPPGTDRPVGRVELLQYIRRNLVVTDAIVNSLFSKFEAYDATEGVAWAGAPADALGALIHIGIPGNSGTVMVTRSEDDNWTFSTVKSPRDQDHPVSGNRRFAIMVADDGKTYLFTLGSDRCTDYRIASSPLLIEPVWFFADKLWKSFQQKAADLVGSLGGIANIVPPISKRHDWSHVVTGYFGPTSAWID